MRLSLHRLLSVPLLAKDLTEMAARRRTYALRVLNAIILFGVFVVALGAILDSDHYLGLGAIGRGFELFVAVACIQMGAIYVVLPATVAPAITYEKERNALELLLLTGISPSQILLQKLVSRLVPVISLLLLSLPLMAIAYSYGGLGALQIAEVAYILLITCLQVGAVGLMWSCFCRTTAEAFVLTYLSLAAIYFGPPLMWEMVNGRYPGVLGEAILLGAVPPFHLAMTLDAGPRYAGLWSTAMTWVTIVAALVMARIWIIRRMNAKPRRYLMRLLHSFDAMFTRLNRFTGGRMVVRDSQNLPADKPVAWREVTSRWIGRPQHLIRVLLVVEIPLILWCFYEITQRDPRWATDMFSGAIFMFWIGAALLLIVSAVNVTAAERAHQTLDVLLTTPMTGGEILAQKLSPLRRLTLAVCVPLLTLMVLQWWWEPYAHQRRWQPVSPMLYAFISALTLAVYLPLCVWGSVTIALYMRSHGRALIAAVISAAAVCFVPLAFGLLILAFGPLSGGDDDAIWPILAFSPPMIIASNEFNAIGQDTELSLLAALIPLAVTGGAVLLMRWHCFDAADRLLGRAVMSDDLLEQDRRAAAANAQPVEP